MKKIMLAASAAFLLGLIVYACISFFTPEETRLRRLVIALQRSFDRGDASSVGASLATDFQDVDSGLGRDDILTLLRGAFYGERMQNGGFPHRAALSTDAAAPGGLKIILENNPKTGAPEARLQVTVHFSRLTFKEGKPDGEFPTGVIEFEGQLIQEEGEWKFLRARMKLVEGRLPF